ncbi:hypothetical protein FEM48_Zijuj02G0133700 [Ziziphus jujuba var. spinosa]|uniref:GATA-type domain-containing protein n=1 Tax=Ziziphus jujuba var. spinosa TaxID=714518 RepID=A0A978VVY9_ZIZJJ|nr:hypothetical protein FEM48_Zijuj02G0133700 [Ziziphus jujuba var. spinosa]
MGMMDLRKKVGSKSGYEKSLPEGMNESNEKCCTDCKTTKTPLWRGGPAGPKTLCNACGIRHRKKRIPVVRLSNRTERKRERLTCSHGNTKTSSATTTTTTTTTTTISPTSSDENGGRDSSESLKARIMALGMDVFLQSSSVVKKQRWQKRRKLGEEEQAAVSLMALSCGSVFA